MGKVCDRVKEGCNVKICDRKGGRWWDGMGCDGKGGDWKGDGDKDGTDNK